MGVLLSQAQGEKQGQEGCLKRQRRSIYGVEVTHYEGGRIEDYKKGDDGY